MQEDLADAKDSILKKRQRKPAAEDAHEVLSGEEDSDSAQEDLNRLKRFERESQSVIVGPMIQSKFKVGQSVQKPNTTSRDTNIADHQPRIVNPPPKEDEMEVSEEGEKFMIESHKTPKD